MDLLILRLYISAVRYFGRYLVFICCCKYIFLPLFTTYFYSLRLVLLIFGLMQTGWSHFISSLFVYVIMKFWSHSSGELEHALETRLISNLQRFSFLRFPTGGFHTNTWPVRVLEIFIAAPSKYVRSVDMRMLTRTGRRVVSHWFSWIYRQIVGTIFICFYVQWKTTLSGICNCRTQSEP